MWSRQHTAPQQARHAWRHSWDADRAMLLPHKSSNMLSLLQGSKAALPGLGSLRPITSLLDTLPSLLQRQFSTHGVSDSPPSREGGVVRFYKAVNAQPAEQVGLCCMLAGAVRSARRSPQGATASRDCSVLLLVTLGTAGRLPGTIGPPGAQDARAAAARGAHRGARSSHRGRVGVAGGQC